MAARNKMAANLTQILVLDIFQTVKQIFTVFPLQNSLNYGYNLMSPSTS